MADPHNPTPDNADEPSQPAHHDALTVPSTSKDTAEPDTNPPTSAEDDSRYASSNQYPNKLAHQRPNKLRTLIIAMIILGLIGLVAWGLIKDKRETRSQAVTLQGHMDVEQTPVAAKVAGRIATIHVKEGDTIQIGTPLVDMDSPEINAKIEEAQAGKQMAQSQLDKANNGARPQEIDMAKYQYEAAQSAADLAKVTYERINRLASEGLMSRQKRDEAYTNYVASVDKAKIAKAQYELAKTGARNEDKTAAQAQVSQVEGKLKEALIAKQEANLKSPIAGIVDNVIVKSGQVVGQGVPLVTIVDPKNQWVVLNVTENNLSHFAVGSAFTGVVPALSTNNQPYRQVFKVYASSVLSDFATWRPTNSKDGFDMRTFEIRARPQNPDTRLRQGMTVLVDIPATTTTQ